jgi:transcription antitermination factor NusG
VAESVAPWFVLHVRSRCEKRVAHGLRQRGYEEFAPLYWSRRRWSDRVKLVQMPLFAGYVFCRFFPGQRSAILSIPGVVSVVGHGKEPVPVPTSEVEAIRVAIASGQPTTPWPRLEPGQKARIEQGALRGLEGVVLRFRGATQLILAVKLLQRAVAVEVPEMSVVPVGPRFVVDIQPSF